MALIKKFRIKEFKIKKPLAKLEKVSLLYDKRQILDDINFSLNSGEIIGLLGPNGAGKSSIFNLLIGLIKPNFGNIIIENDKVNSYPVYIRARKYKIGYVPQYGGFFHDLTLFENLKAIGEILIDDERKRNARINELIASLLLIMFKKLKLNFYPEVSAEN